MSYTERKYPCLRTHATFSRFHADGRDRDDFRVNGHEIDDAFPRDPQPLTFFDLHGRAGVFRNDLTLRNATSSLFQHTPAKHPDCSLLEPKCQQLRKWPKFQVMLKPDMLESVRRSFTMNTS
jgi:hypothetical protein